MRAIQTVFKAMLISTILSMSSTLYAQEIENEIITDENFTIPFEEIHPLEIQDIDVLHLNIGDQSGEWTSQDGEVYPIIKKYKFTGKPASIDDVLIWNDSRKVFEFMKKALPRYIEESEVVLTQDGDQSGESITQDGEIHEFVQGNKFELDTHDIVVEHIDSLVQGEPIIHSRTVERAKEVIEKNNIDAGHVSDNKQDIDPEWFRQTQRNIGIMSKVFDHLLSEQMGEGYQKSGFFNKGCQGFWVPNTGLMFQLQVNFPLEEKSVAQVEIEESESNEDDLWNKLENQLSGKNNNVKLTVRALKTNTANADRTEDLQNLIMETIAKYGSKFDSMGEDESIIVMVQSPAMLPKVVNVERVVEPFTFEGDGHIFDYRLRTDEENTATLIEEYEIQLKKLHNKLDSEKQQLEGMIEPIKRLSLKRESGNLTEEDNRVEFELKQREIESKRKIRDTEIDIEHIQKKLHELNVDNVKLSNERVQLEMRVKEMDNVVKMLERTKKNDRDERELQINKKGLEELKLELEELRDEPGKKVEHEKEVHIPVSDDTDVFRTEAHVVFQPSGNVTRYPVQGRMPVIGKPLQLQTIPNNKTMVIQIPIKDLQLSRDIFKEDDDLLQKEHAANLKDKFRITIY